MTAKSVFSAGDPYQFHRAALAPLIPGADQADLENAYRRAAGPEANDFARFLDLHGLAPLWDERVEQYRDHLSLAPDFNAYIHRARLQATGSYLIQRHNLARVKDILDDLRVDHVVIKGAHTRELYYETPALRPATDIDVLLRPQDSVLAIKAFEAHDFRFSGAPRNIAQDCNLVRGKTNFDLHWDILRPGRTRQPMVDTLLASRVDCGSHWGLSHAATLFLMLVHPVFRKYSTTPYATLVRLVDLMQLLARHPGAAPGAEQLLEMSGLNTAGWITAQWLRLLVGRTASAGLDFTHPPGKLRRRWLQRWLAGDW